MKEISVAFLHPFANSLDDIRQLLKIDERKLGFLFRLDNESPDYVFGSEHIYYNLRYWDRFYNLYKRHPITIFLGGEAISGDLNLFDYVISYDKHMNCEDRIGRIPLLSFFALEDAFFSQQDIHVNKNRKFCNFLYSNGNAHHRRDELFYLINSYKDVDSLGAHLNNRSCTMSRFSPSWRRDSIAIKSEYKFSISAENAQYRGYTSEKIMTSFLARSIPIYWGNPLVEEEFNPKAFINANKLNDQELLKTISVVDNDDDLYEEMVNQPWMTSNQIEQHYYDKEKYELFIKGIFAQEKKDAYRKGSGTALQAYINFMIS